MLETGAGMITAWEREEIMRQTRAGKHYNQIARCLGMHPSKVIEVQQSMAVDAGVRRG